MRLPAGLVVPDQSEGLRLLRSVPGRRAAPAWWTGRALRHEATLVVSPGAIGLNTQALAVLRAAEAGGTRCLVVVAPHVSDEALATLLVNDLGRVFPDGILPLRVLTTEFHVGELIERMAAYLDVALWDGRPSAVPLVRVGRVAATTDGALVRLKGAARSTRLLRWFPRG